MPLALDHDAHAYIAVTLVPTSTFHVEPRGLAQHPAVDYVGQVGELQDVQLVSVPKAQWPEVEADVLGWLKAREGVVHVQVQSAPKMRARRGGDEL